MIDEFNDAARLKDQSVPVPILITTNGTILAGFGRWRKALFDDRHEINSSSIPSVRKKPYGSSSVTITPSADGMRLSAFAWRSNWSPTSRRGHATT